MGTTLQNGVYLPNEGERNCYAGLKTNWEILDQKVADVTALQQAVAGALHREIVESLPTTDIDPNTIYMILSGTSATENVYNEYMYVNNAWELIGTSATDLTNYYTKGEIDGKLLLKANASDLTSHTGDTTIHVTTADKTKWNNGVSQSYVFRYSSTALVASSTNSNTLLDNTDNLKVGDKVIDLNGVLFSITAIDSVNSTFTVGSALVDLALDANVVHTSGNETISGDKVFNNRLIKNIDIVLGTAPSTGKFSTIEISDNNKYTLLQAMGGVNANGQTYARFAIQNKTADDGTGLSPTGTIRSCGFNINLPASSTSEGQGSITPRANKITDFGLSGYQWRSVWCEKLYLNGTQLDPSAFVTTDTAQTISESKTFANTIKIKKEIELSGNRLAYILPNFSASYSGLSLCTYDASGAVRIGIWKVDDNDNTKHVLNDSLGYLNVSTGSSNSVNIVYLTPRNASKAKLGDSVNKWHEINGLEPSSLSLPDLSNGIDISSYITDLTGNPNAYSPPANGYIAIRSTTANVLGIVENTTGMGSYSRGTNQVLAVNLPVVKNSSITIYAVCSSLSQAKFIPCLGNV